MTNSESSSNTNTYAFNGLTLSGAKRELVGPDGLVSIEKKVLDLLVYLLENRDRVVSKEELQEAIWPKTIVTEAALTRAIMKARRAVDDSADDQKVIRTAHGEGYRFIAELNAPGESAQYQAAIAEGTQKPALTSLITIAVIGIGIALTVFLLLSSDEPLPTKDVKSGTVTIAVLPFDNLSPDPDHAYFAEGIHEEILNQISRSTEIQVLARASVKQFANTDEPVPVISGKLGVDNVLTGSIRYADDRVRVSTQLIEGDTGISLWSNNYDREFEDIFAIQSDVATKIANALNSQVLDDGYTPGSEKSADAYREYLLARSFRARTFQTGWDPVLEHTDKALEYDPAFIPALWLRHNAYQNRIIGNGHADAHRKMLGVTQTAKEANPEHALTLAMIAKDAAYQWDWEASMLAWDRALLADRSNPTVNGDAAFLNIATGNYERASEIIDSAIRANPRHDWAHYANLHLQRALGNEQTFLETADLIVSIGSNRAFPTAFTMALYHSDRGDVARVQKYGEVLSAMTRGQLQPVVDMLVAITRGEEIDPEALKRYADSTPPSNNYLWMEAEVYLAIDAPAYALAVLERIADNRSLYSVIKVTTDPAFASVRSTAEYQTFLRKVRLKGQST
jgi:TolB-like protein/DNA-binding winged helix-turn-helix (wHTH) protein